MKYTMDQIGLYSNWYNQCVTISARIKMNANLELASCGATAAAVSSSPAGPCTAQGLRDQRRNQQQEHHPNLEQMTDMRSVLLHSAAAAGCERYCSSAPLKNTARLH